MGWPQRRTTTPVIFKRGAGCSSSQQQPSSRIHVEIQEGSAGRRRAPGSRAVLPWLDADRRLAQTRLFTCPASPLTMQAGPARAIRGVDTTGIVRRYSAVVMTSAVHWETTASNKAAAYGGVDKWSASRECNTGCGNIRNEALCIQKKGSEPCPPSSAARG